MKKRLIFDFLFFILFAFIILNPVTNAIETEVHIIFEFTDYLKEYKYTGVTILHDRLYIPLGQVTVIEGYILDWDTNSKILTITISETSPLNLSKKRVIIQNNLKTPTCYSINENPYYFIEKESGLPLRVIFEPLCQIKWERNGNIHTVFACENPFYNRVKLLPQSSEIIINYELHKLNSGLIKQSKEVFISLREFIELMKGEIKYNPTSQYNSPEIIIKPVNINKEIKIYPQLNKAILINEDNEIREINFLNNLINKNGSYFIGLNDIISILEAEKHTYLDSDINTYFNFEF